MTTKICFVVMGFGEKTDFQTQRKLDLDKTYRGIIKPAVEGCGVKCIRADDITHSGVIDKPMYENLLDADLVIADLSTANPNAIYELGVRHALKPNTTIIMVEDKFKFPFDLQNVLIRTYQHLGTGIDFEEVERFKSELKQAIKELVLGEPKVDSPVYTFLTDLQQPVREDTDAEPAQPLADTAPSRAGREADAAAADKDQLVMGALLESAREAREKEDFAEARILFRKLHEMDKSEAYFTQQLALATYKARQPDDEARLGALEQARAIVENHLDPAATNDPETLGLWGAIHKRLWDMRGFVDDLGVAVRAYERGYYLKRDYYNGVNYALVLNLRANVQTDSEEAIADRVLAKRVRRRVLDLLNATLQSLPQDENHNPVDPAEAYWIRATRLEALMGLGEHDAMKAEMADIFDSAPESWMAESTREQLELLEKIL